MKGEVVNRKLVAIAVGVSIPILAGGIAMASNNDPVVRPAGSTEGRDIKAPPVRVGDVIGRARLENGLCVFDRPIGVAIDPGSEVEVVWGFDEKCRAVISSVGKPSALDSESKPRNGQTVTPTIQEKG